ncbi:MAG TPA: SEL1-like repeat protein [Terriglobales bacterium]|nr:SEL1-like repeat protein [Terriglobales bacterium]
MIGQRVRKALAPVVKNPVLVVVPLALICVLYFWIVRSGRMPKQGASASVVSTTSPETRTRSVTAPESAPQLAVPATGSFPGATPAAKKTIEIADDPAQLWKRVARGDAGAEIELAKMYLDGVRVAQNCEQARLLLLAASKKGSTVASNLLSGTYSQRCR